MKVTTLKEIVVSKLDFDSFRLRDAYTGEVVDYSLRDELKVNEDNYEQEYLNQPAKYVYWQAVYQNLKSYQESVEREADIVHANAYNEAYNFLKQNKGITRPTKDLIDSAIMQDKDYQKELEKVEEAHRAVGIIGSIVKAFEQRKDMLIQFGAEQRANRNNSN